jgi:hypothetical protein
MPLSDAGFTGQRALITRMIRSTLVLNVVPFRTDF